MFNPLEPARLVETLGLLLREGASSGGAGDAFDQAQLAAGHSIAKHLTAELKGAPQVTRWFRAAALDRLAAAGGSGEVGEPLAAEVQRAKAALGNSETIQEMGVPLSMLLRAAAADPAPEAAALRSELHGLLRELADREINTLAGTA